MADRVTKLNIEDSSDLVISPATEGTLSTLNGKLPAAGALADGAANPTLSKIASYLKGFNGTTWDRLRAGVTTLTATLTGLLNTLPWAVYNATPTTRTEGQGGPLQADTKGNLKSDLGTLLSGEDQANAIFAIKEVPLASNTYSPDIDVSAAAEASSVTKASLGNLYSFTANNTNAANRYFQFYNSATVPADAVVPAISYLCVAGGTISDIFPFGRYFSTGISWAWSTTHGTKTIGSTDGIADVRYK